MSGVYDCDMKGEGLSSFHISIFQFLRFYLCLCCVILSFVALDYNYVPNEELLVKVFIPLYFIKDKGVIPLCFINF